MTLPDLVFLASVLWVGILTLSIADSACRGRVDRRRIRWLAVFLAGYAAVLVLLARVMPRRYYAAGECRCFDDWCVTALDATVVNDPAFAACPSAPGNRTWVAVVQVSSVALRVRQRARDAWVELEDHHGNRYPPCAAPLASGAGPARSLSDEVGPGESFRVRLPFRLPATATPSGTVVHHGAFPGVLIPGGDQSFLHPPALMRLRSGGRD